MRLDLHRAGFGEIPDLRLDMKIEFGDAKEASRAQNSSVPLETITAEPPIVASCS